MIHRVISTATIITIILLCQIHVSAQDTIWYDANWDETNDKELAEFYRPPAKKVGDDYLITDYYKSGVKQMEGLSYEKGEGFWNGTVVWYYPNGDTSRTIEYENNVVNGKFMEYYGNGKVAGRSEFKNNVPHGMVEYYYYNGKLESKGNYKNGKPDGETTSFYRDGKPKEIGNYKDGKWHGNWKRYDMDGKVDAELEYEYGEKVREIVPLVIHDVEMGSEAAANSTYPPLEDAWLPKVEFSSKPQDEGTTYTATFNFDGYNVTCTYATDEDLVYNLKYFSNQPEGNEVNFYFTKHDSTYTTYRYYGFRLGKVTEQRLKKSKTGLNQLIAAIHQSLPDEHLDKFEIAYYLDLAMDGDNTEEEIIIEDVIDVEIMDVEIMDVEVEEESDEENYIFHMVEETPEFPGGDDSLKAFITNSIQFPEEHIKDTAATKVFVQFVVEKDGNVNNIEVVKSGGGAFDKEALRIVNTLPKFKPGKQRGKPVPVWFTLPIKFEPPGMK